MVPSPDLEDDLIDALQNVNRLLEERLRRERQLSDRLQLQVSNLESKIAHKNRELIVLKKLKQKQKSF